MKDTECPYCHKDQEICHDDGHGMEEGEIYSQECGDCGKTFAFTTTISISHEAFAAPCLNGEPHDLKPVRGVPEEFFVGVQRCKVCDTEVVDKAANKAAIDSYRAKHEAAPRAPGEKEGGPA